MRTSSSVPRVSMYVSTQLGMAMKPARSAAVRARR
jgi:hypothetical protein